MPCLRRVLLALLFFLALPGGPAIGADRPNLLIIMTDNQSPSLLGTYGNAEIRTPNIDRLAAEGLQFDRAFAVSGVCSPTRATFFTGLLPSQHGVHSALPDRERPAGRQMPPNWSAIQEFRSLPRTLADAGYRTGLVGKFHLGAHEVPQLGFQEWVTFGSGHTSSFYGEEIHDNGKVYTEPGHMTDLWTRRAEEFLARQSAEQPFFLFVSYNGPYILPPVVLKEPRNPHVAYYRANPPAMPQEPVHPKLMNLASRNPPSPLLFRVGFGGWPQIQALNNRDAMINIASEMSTVDDGVGRILDTLENSGLADDTLVIFTSDQGSLYGQHGLWGNPSAWWPPTNYDEHLRVPLILRHDGKIPAGSRSELKVRQFDFLRTLLDYLGMAEIEIANSPGQSFAATLTDPQATAPARDVYAEFITTRVIRTDRWLYQKSFLIGDDVLYDLQTDPAQSKNLVTEPDYQSTVAELDARLGDFFQRHADPRYDLWRGGTAKLRLFGRDDRAVFTEAFPDWQPPGLGYGEVVFRDR